MHSTTIVWNKIFKNSSLLYAQNYLYSNTLVRSLILCLFSNKTYVNITIRLL